MLLNRKFYFMSICKKITAVFILSFFFAGFSLAADVSVSPASQTIAQGSSVSVTININNVSDMFGAAFDLIYDPAILSFVSASKGSFLEQGGNSTTLATSNSNGTLIVGYSRQAVGGVSTGVAGSGTLMTLNFSTTASGTSALSFQNNALCAATGSGCPVISAVWSNGSIAVSSNAPTADTSAPSIPTNLSASTISTSQISLSWSASTDNVGVTGYSIFRNGSQITSIAETTFTDGNLSAGTSYNYTVSAFDVAGNLSNQAASVSATTQSNAVNITPSGSTTTSTAQIASDSSTTTTSQNYSDTITPSSPALLTTAIKEGDLIRGPDKIKVYIINYYGYKRHIFNPAIFNMYGHFKWDQIKDVSQEIVDSYKISDLYRADGDSKVFSLREVDEANGKAEKQWLDLMPDDFISQGYNWNQIFVINKTERDYYQEGSPITKNTLVLPALVKVSGGSKIYFITSSGYKKPILNEQVFNSYSANSWSNIKEITQNQLDSYPQIDGIVYNDKVYILNFDNGTKTWIQNESEFKSQNLDWKKIVSVNQTEFEQYK